MPTTNVDKVERVRQRASYVLGSKVSTWPAQKALQAAGNKLGTAVEIIRSASGDARVSYQSWMSGVPHELIMDLFLQFKKRPAILILRRLLARAIAVEHYCSEKQIRSAICDPEGKVDLIDRNQCFQAFVKALVNLIHQGRKEEVTEYILESPISWELILEAYLVYSGAKASLSFRNAIRRGREIRCFDDPDDPRGVCLH